MQLTHKRDDNWSRLLLRVSRHRDPNAFEGLFNHFAPLIKGYHYSRPISGLNTDATEELVQNVMFKVWQQAPLFEARKVSASTWIFAVMRNCRVELMRRYQQQPDARIDVDDIWNDTTDRQPFIFFQKLRSQEFVAHRLQKLPVEQSQVIKKIYMEGKTHGEVSAELGLPLGTVKSRVHLALRKLHHGVTR